MGLVKWSCNPKKAGLVGKNRLQGKIEDRDGGIWYGSFLAPKVKYSQTIYKTGIIDEQKTFSRFTNVSYTLDSKEYFNMADGGKTKS